MKGIACDVENLMQSFGNGVHIQYTTVPLRDINFTDRWHIKNSVLGNCGGRLWIQWVAQTSGKCTNYKIIISDRGITVGKREQATDLWFKKNVFKQDYVWGQTTWPHKYTSNSYGEINCIIYLKYFLGKYMNINARV